MRDFPGAFEFKQPSRFTVDHELLFNNSDVMSVLDGWITVLRFKLSGIRDTDLKGIQYNWVVVDIEVEERDNE